jgi:hypothetical protein
MTAVKDVKKQLSVAVLIHETSQWSEALRTGKALSETGAAVSLFYLGCTPINVEHRIADDVRLEWYSDTCQAGMQCLSLNEIARKLKGCDLVIPI